MDSSRIKIVLQRRLRDIERRTAKHFKRRKPRSNSHSKITSFFRWAFLIRDLSLTRLLIDTSLYFLMLALGRVELAKLVRASFRKSVSYRNNVVNLHLSTNNFHDGRSLPHSGFARWRSYNYRYGHPLSHDKETTLLVGKKSEVIFDSQGTAKKVRVRSLSDLRRIDPSWVVVSTSENELSWQSQRNHGMHAVPPFLSASSSEIYASFPKGSALSPTRIAEAIMVNQQTAQQMKSWESKVLFVSRAMGRRFGGVEDFITTVAKSYRELGFQTFIYSAPETKNTEIDFPGVSAVRGGLDRFTLRRRIIEHQITHIHVFPGMWDFVFSSTYGLPVKKIYGIHYWRDLLKDQGEQVFFRGADPFVNPSFRQIIAEADVTYANSRFVQELVHDHFGVILPQLQSVPIAGSRKSAHRQLEDTGNRPTILLSNAQQKKGADIALAVAKLLPQYNFVILNSQPGGSQAINTHRANVSVWGQLSQSQFRGLLSEVDLVIAPSFTHVESFGRVVLESQRFGTPVLASGVGNHRYTVPGPQFLVDSQDPSVWAERIAYLLENRAALETAKLEVRKNWLRWKKFSYVTALTAVLKSQSPNTLLCVGSGIGNSTHLSPLISQIVRESGRPIDILMNSENPGQGAIFANSHLVGLVYESADVVSKHYAKVFVSHSFGGVAPNVSADFVAISRNFEMFHPGHKMHEATFNLYAARNAGIIETLPPDLSHYWTGSSGFPLQVPVLRRIGIHSGSQNGKASTKRWPGYELLAKHLRRQGYEVCSFGSGDEFVPGTTDLTGTRLSETLSNIRTCYAFIGNDSGISHLADATGIATIFLFAPTNLQTRGPVTPWSTYVRTVTDCSPCEIKNPEKWNAGQCRCINEISLDQVLLELEKVLRAGNPRRRGV